MALIFLRYASLLLLGFATLAILMMMLMVAAEAQENGSNSGTPAGAKSLIAPKSDRSEVAETSNKGDDRPRQIIVEEAKTLPSKKIEIAKGEEITPAAPKSSPAPKPLTAETADDAAAEIESAPGVPAPKAKAPVDAAPAPTLSSDSYHTAYRHSFYGHAYGYGYSDDDYDGCE